MQNYLNCKKIATAINRAKKFLIERAKTTGMYENFGQIEVRAIEDTFIDCCDYSPEMNRNRKALSIFDEWCSTFTLNYHERSTNL